MPSQAYLQQLADQTKNPVDIDSLPPEYNDPSFSGPVMSPQQQHAEKARSDRSQLPPDPDNQSYAQEVWNVARPFVEGAVPGGGVIVPAVEKVNSYAKKVEEAKKRGESTGAAIGSALNVNGVSPPPEQATPPPAQQTEKDQPVGVEGDQAIANAPSNMPASQWVEAHEVAGVDPERQAALENAYGDEAKARLQAGDIMANGQAVGADQQMAAARQELADEDQIAQNRDARHAYLDRLAADVESDSKDLANSKIDPDRYWHSRTTPQAIFGVIGMALGGFLQGFRGGRNPAADQIQSLIENDIKAQRDNLENKWEGVRMKHSLLADKAARYNSLDIAERQQVAARLQGAVLMANAAAARATSPVERANALALASQLEQKAIESGITMNKWVNAGYAGGGAPGKIAKDVKPANLVRIGDQWIDTGDATTALNFSKQNISADHIIDQAQSLIQLLQDPETLNPFSSKRGPLNAISKQISIDDMNEAGGGQRGGVGYMRFLNEAQGPASSFLPYKRQQAIAALQQFINKAVADKEARARSLSGAPVVSRNVDLQNQKVDYQYTGTFNPTSGASSASPDSVGYKRVGQ